MLFQFQHFKCTPFMSVFLVLTQAYRNFTVWKLIAAFDMKTAIIGLNNKIFDPTTLNFQTGQRITLNTNKSLQVTYRDYVSSWNEIFLLLPIQKIIYFPWSFKDSYWQFGRFALLCSVQRVSRFLLTTIQYNAIFLI